MKITFLGATEGVTGSNYLLEAEDKKIMVDCGLYQGTPEEEKQNWQNFEYNPKEIDILIVTHSHIDHIGLIPKLYKDGFRGVIYSTPATYDFATIFLEDSCEILKKSSDRHQKPYIYELTDVTSCLKLFETVPYHVKKNIAKNSFFTFFDAGHILGSAFIKLESGGKTIVFSGDLGNPPVPIIKDTEYIKDADYVVVESTYGDRMHKKSEGRRDELENVIEDTYSKRGTLLIPAFAMERTQELLYEINELLSENRIPKIPVYIDSPLAIKATNIYPKYINDFDADARDKIKRGQKLFDFSGLRMTESVEESKKIDADRNPKIVIAGSGMSTGGRIVHHEIEFLPLESTVLLIIGFQVEGTLGRKLVEGAKEVNIRGQYVPVNAKVISLDSYSAHADWPKLIHWLSQMGNEKLKKIFLTHGEATAKKIFRSKVQDETGVETIIATKNMEVTL